jgi:hypothetical protein
MMSTTTNQVLHWSKRFRNILQQIEPLGSFVYHKVLENVPSMLPHITIQNVGRIGLPILDVDKLMNVATKAPYGKRDQTIYDDTIRTAYQIDASQIAIGNDEKWKTFFNEQIVQHCCFQLGISKERYVASNIQANLYKMLIYETNGHFKPHRDTEKEVGMFGTMILQLPTSDGFTGGLLTVQHDGMTKTVDMTNGSDNEFQVVSFYADCEHQLHPITSGHRVCLVYNLVATPLEETNKSIPSQAINDETEMKLRSIFDEWTTKAKKTTKIGYQLEHSYTYQSIGFNSLKGRDEIVLATLRNAKNSNGEKLFYVAILLMEYHRVMDYMHDESEYKMKPFKMIEENVDGSIKETNVEKNGNWDMECHSEKGWWVVNDAFIKHGDILTDDVEDDNDDEDLYDEDLREKGIIEDDDGNDIPLWKQMYLTTNEYRFKEHGYNGNDGGHQETWYYSAAIIIAPYHDSVMNHDPAVNHKRGRQDIDRSNNNGGHDNDDDDDDIK